MRTSFQKIASKLSTLMLCSHRTWSKFFMQLMPKMQILSLFNFDWMGNVINVMNVLRGERKRKRTGVSGECSHCWRGETVWRWFPAVMWQRTERNSGISSGWRRHLELVYFHILLYELRIYDVYVEFEWSVFYNDVTWLLRSVKVKISFRRCMFFWLVRKIGVKDFFFFFWHFVCLFCLLVGLSSELPDLSSSIWIYGGYRTTFSGTKYYYLTGQAGCSWVTH